MNLDMPTDVNRSFNRMAKNVDPDNTAPEKPSHLVLHNLNNIWFGLEEWTDSNKKQNAEPLSTIHTLLSIVGIQYYKMQKVKILICRSR